ncbi:MAG: hypothetical protein GX089_16055 [Fibrobacter sp.]|jgi:hypothetical protein|nr:hypothetical protein [Fibrobacter sp.]
MSFTYDHEKFVAKNRSLASAQGREQRDQALEKKGYSHLKSNKEGSCFNCKQKQNCSEFRAKRSGGASGVVSFGGDENFICSKYTPAQAQAKGMSDKQIKSLLKNVKKGY